MWDLILSVPEHCLSFYLDLFTDKVRELIAFTSYHLVAFPASEYLILNTRQSR